MMRHRPTPFILSSLVLLTVAACGPSGPRTVEELLPTLNGARISPPFPKVPFTLDHISGEPYDFIRETDGYVTLLFFGYTYCPDICPIQLSAIASAWAELDVEVTDRVRVIFVTADPERDTPERMREWLGAFDAPIVGLRGDRQEVNRIVVSLGMPPISDVPRDGGEYEVVHPAPVFVYTPDNQGRLLYMSGIPARYWVEDLPALTAFRWSEATP